ncbi:MAG: HD domain-containing protein [Candidatus Micrarchaeia archaeon]
MELNADLENKIKEVALRYMENARPNWDVPHMYATVFYIKKLIEKEGGNPNILIPTMYLHDIGYAGLISEPYSFEHIEKVKQNHMKIGAELSEKYSKK